MSINKARSAMYFTSKILGDVNAILKLRIFRRIGVRVIGRMLGKLMGKVF